MNVSLTPELERFVHAKVQKGRYNSASEVVREALRLMDERDQFIEFQKDDIRRKIAEGLASSREGRLTDGENFMAQMDQELVDGVLSEGQKSTCESVARP